MKLIKVQIRNYRSIKELDIESAPSCKILVGINESGKSNILAALALLSPDVMPEKDDVRYESTDEAYISDALVRFHFSLEDYEQSQLYEIVKAKVMLRDESQVIANYKGRDLTLKELCYKPKIGLYRINLIKQTKHGSYFKWGEGFETDEQLKKPSSLCPKDLVVTDDNGESAKLADLEMINGQEFPHIDTTYLEPFSSVDLEQLIGGELASYVESNLPSCLIWSYSEQNLLPAQINLTSFAADPNSCVPLKNMFELAGIAEITDELNRRKSQSIHALRNLLEKVSRRTTDYIRSVWNEPEYKNVQIELAPNGDNIDASVMDTSIRFNFAKRSDGFKRFISFLLMISAKVNTQTLENAILLIDEPEVGLHPSGARHLLKELIKIADTNQVIFSTHSIFMIDREAISRHLIVKKEGGITSAMKAESSNVVDEEVLYNAIGYSVFETLKKRNILFEGWRDKKLFQTALKGLQKADELLKQTLVEIGTCHAKGVKDIRSVSAFIELANRQCLIISDDDDPAREKQRQYQSDRGYGVWKRYTEIDTSIKVVTGEDFLKAACFHKPLAAIRKEKPALPVLSEGDLCGPSGKVKSIEKWLTENGVSVEEARSILNSIKDVVFDKLKPSDIDQSYRTVLKFIAQNGTWE